MRPLKPLATFAGGTVLMAIAVASAVVVADSDLRGPRGVTVGVVMGGIFGMLVFGSIAAGDGLRSTFVRRHFEQFDRYSALLMAAGLGHCLDTWLGANGIVIAYALVFFGACFRTYLHGAAKRPAA